MEYLYIYGLFCLTTALCTLYELISPVLFRLKQHGKKAPPAFVCYFTAICLSILFAPIMFICCVVPSLGFEFREKLYEQWASLEE